MQNHFELRRWERDEPRLMAVMVPPTDSSVVTLVTDVHRYLRQAPSLRCVDPTQLCLPLVDIGWSTDVTDGQVAELAQTLVAVARQTVLATRPIVRGIHVDDAEIRMRLRNDRDIRTVRAAVVAATRMVLNITPQPTAPCLDVAYCIRGATTELARTRPHKVLAVAHAQESLDLRVGSWSASRIDFVDVVQDRHAGSYRWSVRASAPLPGAPVRPGPRAIAPRSSADPATTGRASAIVGAARTTGSMR